MKKVVRRAATVLVAVAVLGSAGAALFVFSIWNDLERTVVEKMSGRRWSLPSRVYAEPLTLYPGVDLQALGWTERLQRLGYREVSPPVAHRGDYARLADGFEIRPRDFAYPTGFPEPQTVGTGSDRQRIRLRVDGSTLLDIHDADTGEEMFSLRIEPEMITGLYDSVWEDRQLVTLSSVSPLLVRAILATEDRRFHEHHGVDPVGILRAAVTNLRRGRLVQGGSTLTQQLMKNFFLTDERTFDRKWREMLMAIIAERRYTKDEILEAYLNEIYLGQSGAQSIHGVWEAAQFYFARPLSELSAGECALLAGMIRAPGHYSPHSFPDRARERRDVILGLLREEGIIDENAHRLALDEAIRSVPQHKRRNAAPYFVDYLRRDLQENYPADVLTSEGFRIFTSLDPHLQKLAERAVEEGLARIEKSHPKLKSDVPGEQLQAALVALRPQTGEIRAMVGGRSYQGSQFNRATQARRQPGSVFKPVVYLAAFAGTRGDDEPLEPTSVLEDSPFEWSYENQTWTPENYGDRYAGEVPVRDALELSLNAATARLARGVGITRIRELALRMGFREPLPAYPSMVLGAIEASPLEVAEAYTVFANQGLRTLPRAVHKVVDRSSNPIERRAVEVEQVVDSASAFLVTHVMKGVLDHGTATEARRSGFVRPAAGKTGTTNDEKDAWFAGFTPDLLTVVWVGFDDNRPLRLTGAQAALPIWTEFMKSATAGTSPIDFVPPPGVALVTIDPYTNGVAGPGCPDQLLEAFRKGHEPTDPCTVH